jgi:predicted transcriptional regulator
MDSMMTETPQTVLQEIKAETGWSEPRIAREIGTSQPTINRLMNGQPECKASTWRAMCDLRDRVKVKAPPAPSRSRRKPPSVSNLK